MKVPGPTYLSPTAMSREESHLLEFFHESKSLVLGPTDEEVLAQFILKVAFSDSSNATNPVLQCVFALASLQLQGSSKSFRYKHLAVSSVAKENIDWLDEKTLLQNLMAAMLLYHYEVVHLILQCGPCRRRLTTTALTRVGFQRHLGSVFLRSEKDH